MVDVSDDCDGTLMSLIHALNLASSPCYPAEVPFELALDQRAMANIKSQIKRNRQNEVRRARNKSTRSSLKTRIKNFLQMAESGDGATAQEEFRGISKALDQAAAKGVIHKNQAANKKSRLARKLPS